MPPSKPEDYIESYKNSEGKEIVIANLTNGVLLSTYRSMQTLVRGYKDMRKPKIIKSGARGKEYEITIENDKVQLEEIIKEYQAIKHSLKYEAVLRKLITR